MFVQLVTYNKYWFCTEQRVHLQYISVFRWGVHKGSFPVGLCGEKYCFHGSGRLCLLYFQSSAPVPVLLGPLVSYCLHTDQTSLHKQHLKHYTNVLTFPYKHNQEDSFPDGLNSYRTHLWTDKSAVADASPQMSFLHPSGCQTTSRLQYEMRTMTWQQRGREFIMEGARQTSYTSETSLR